MKRVLPALFFFSVIKLFSNSYFEYEVERHDSVNSIALKFNVEKDEILIRNSLDNKEYIYAGQKLDIPVSYDYYPPIPGSLAEIMNTSTTNWRNPGFELYSWSVSPNVLIFDTINYSFQSLMFKRLAFFVEKIDYIGNIYTLDEISGEKGWNGHDYNAEDLARFFNKVDYEGHTITRGEEILLKILLKNNILRKTNYGYRAIGGAVVSCSRSSYYNHRYTILRHELYHGLYFTSEKFRQEVKKVWGNLDYQSKTIWKMYMEVLEYNTRDEDLMMNEFMAYLLQQSEDETYYYMNEIVWFRLWDYFPDKRTQINRFFNADNRPFRRQIKELRSYTSTLNID